MKYNFKILSTIDTSDFSDKIRVGDDLYASQEFENDLYDTKNEAIEAGYELMTGLDGGKAYNLALNSADVIAIDK